jgi:hypothetical protein
MLPRFCRFPVDKFTCVTKAEHYCPKGSFCSAEVNEKGKQVTYDVLCIPVEHEPDACMYNNVSANGKIDCYFR